jgi:O-antigen ligase
MIPGCPVINNIFTGGLFVFCWFYPGTPGSGLSSLLREKLQTLRSRKEIFFMLLFYSWHIVSALLSNNRHEASQMLVLRLPLLVFPLSFGLIYMRDAVKDWVIQAYGIVVSLGALVCVVYAWMRYAHSGDGVYLYNDSLTEVLDIQSSYYALMVLLAVAGFIYLLGKGIYSKRKGRYVQAVILLLLIFHFMLASRISIVVLYAGLLIVLGSYLVQRRKTTLAIWVVIGLLGGLGLCMKVLPKTLNRFRELEYPSYSYTRVAPESHYNGTLTPDQWNGANIRLAIWKCGWEEAERHWLTGVQLGDKQDSLMAMYKEKGFTFALERKRNMHNNYLDIFASFGLVGLVLFLAGYLILPLWKAARKRDLLGLALLLVMLVSMGVESYFDRSLGCLVMSFFFSFIAAYKPAGVGLTARTVLS